MHVAFDVVLVGVALIGVFLFIIFERPRLQIALMLLIALVWGVELTFISNGTRAARLVAFWHPIFAISTALAAVGIVFLRGVSNRS
jgi:hypothetical protein